MSNQSAPTLSVEPSSYQVQQGDSFARIAREQYGDERYAALIMAENGIDPTYGNVHGLQTGKTLMLPDISGYTDSELTQALRTGGSLISADQAITDQIAAEQSKLATQQSSAVPIDPRTGLRAGPTIENAAALGLPTESLAQYPVQATGTIGADPGLFANLKGIGSALLGGQIGLGDALAMAKGNIGYSYRIADEEYGITNRIIGGVGVVGSTVETATGVVGAVVTSETVVGAAAFSLLAANGVDNFRASYGMLTTGQRVDPLGLQLINQGSEALGIDPIYGESLYAGANLIGGTAGSINVASRLGRAAEGANEIADNLETVRVFRVEGSGNQRLLIDESGNVNIPTVWTNKGRGPERNLYLNFGDESRAGQFLEQRLTQFPDNTIKSFEVPKSFVEELRATAVPEAKRALYPARPVIADPTKAADQFGLTAEQIQKLRQVIVPGSGR